MKRPGKHRRGRVAWICRGSGGASPGRVGRLNGCGGRSPEVGKMQGVGWASRHYRALGSGAASSLNGKGVKGVFGSPWLSLRCLWRCSLDISANRTALPQGRANTSPQHAFAVCLPPHIPPKEKPPRCRLTCRLKIS